MKLKAKKRNRETNKVPTTFENPFDNVGSGQTIGGMTLNGLDPSTKPDSIITKPQKPKKKPKNEENKPKDKPTENKPKDKDNSAFLEPGNISTEGLGSTFPSFETATTDGASNTTLIGVVVVGVVAVIVYFVVRKRDNK